LTSADLKFFNSKCFDPVVVPRNVSQVLEVASKTLAEGLTAPAAALENYYLNKKVVKFFVVVTDEIENEKYNKHFFPDLFLKYHKEVYPAKIVFVSFLENPSQKGRMVQALENMGVIPLQFKLDANRPDLQKLDSLLGLLACESSSFVSQIQQVAAQIKEKGLLAVLQSMEENEPSTSGSTTTTTTTTITSDTEMGVEAKEDNPEVALFVREEREKAEQRQKEKDKDEMAYEAQVSAKGLCVVCEENKVNMVLLECGHLILCDKCTPQIVEKNSCPLCRAPVLRALKVYHNV